MNREEDLEWELRPGGMLVQKREDGDNNGGVGGGDSGSGSAMINIKVCHGSNHHQLHVPIQSTFGTPLTLSFGYCFSGKNARKREGKMIRFGIVFFPLSFPRTKRDLFEVFMCGYI